MHLGLIKPRLVLKLRNRAILLSNRSFKMMSLPFYRSKGPVPVVHGFRLNTDNKQPETAAEFEALLTKLRPKPEKVEAIFQREGNEVGVLIYTTLLGERKLQYVLSPEVRNELAFQGEVETLVEFYKHPPRLWPGCRGMVARYLEVEIDREFNRWFDTLANADRHH
jgi:hypothetical protein